MDGRAREEELGILVVGWLTSSFNEQVSQSVCLNTMISAKCCVKCWHFKWQNIFSFGVISKRNKKKSTQKVGLDSNLVGEGGKGKRWTLQHGSDGWGAKKLRVSRCPDLVWSQHTSNASSTAFYNCHDIVQRRQRQRHKYKDECKDKTRTGVESAYHHHPQLLTMWQLKLTIKTTKAYNKRTEPTK